MSDTTALTPQVKIRNGLVITFLLLPLWAFQYSMAVPACWIVHIVGTVARFGLFAFFLLFIPIIGWIILAVMVFGKKAPRQPSNTPYTPWGTGLIIHEEVIRNEA